MKRIQSSMIGLAMLLVASSAQSQSARQPSGVQPQSSLETRLRVTIATGTMDSTSNGRRPLLGASIGAAVGATAGLLYALQTNVGACVGSCHGGLRATSLDIGIGALFGALMGWAVAEGR